MVTKEQALTAKDFHFGECVKTVGPRGGVRITQEIWRRSGQTKTWKRAPDAFSVPIKYGLYNYSYVDHTNENTFHVAEDCTI